MNLKALFRKKDETPKCSAVIVAAGSSQRMGTDKVFMKLGPMPVLVRTVLAFQDNPLIEEIIIVTRKDKLEEVADLCHNCGLSKVSKVVIGGSTRMESALAGVSEVKKGAKLVAIHDGARPLVTQDVINRVVYDASVHMSSIPVIPSTDTLKAVDDDGNVTGTVDRSRTVRVQTPQVFDADLIKGALTNNRRLLRHGHHGHKDPHCHGGRGQHQDHNAERHGRCRSDHKEQRRLECE